jgi:hypothetical protein
VEYFQSSLAHATGNVVLIIIRKIHGKIVYKILKSGEIRELLTEFTIVNAKDSLWTTVQNFRFIVEFPGEGLELPTRSMWQV